MLTLSVLAIFATSAHAASSNQRVDWDKLNAEQQSALKTPTLQAKELNSPVQKSYFYKEGQRTALEIRGDGNQAVFRLEGSGTDLRYAGRGEIKLVAATGQTELKTKLERYGLELGRSLDSNGLVWTVRSPSGLPGLKALNSLKESGLVLSASPDWQRDLRKK